MGSTSGANRFADLKTILDYGFNNFVRTSITTNNVKPTVSQVIENDKIVATVAINPASDMYYLRHSSVSESEILFTTDIKDSYSWYDINPSVTLTVPDNTYMYSNIGSFELTHTEKQLTNPIPVQGSVNEDDNKNEKDEVLKDKKPLPTGLKVFLIIIGSIFILIGALVILFFVSNARRRKRDKLRRLRRQEMYEKSRREMLAAKENAKK
jgi:D-alanyl-D-alanine carboxypeptidase